MRQEYGEQPAQVEVSWSSDPAANTMMTLTRIDGLPSLATQGGTQYSLYALHTPGATDVVSHHLLTEKVPG